MRTTATSTPNQSAGHVSNPLRHQRTASKKIYFVQSGPAWDVSAGGGGGRADRYGTCAVGGGMTRAGADMGEYGGLSASLWESRGERTMVGRVRLRHSGTSADRGGQAADSAREGWAFDVRIDLLVIRECHACRPKPKEEQLRRECRQRRAEDGQRAQ
ncbi:hypothetical protein BKA93DRAFT_813968 [Sparassis latifolia]